MDADGLLDLYVTHFICWSTGEFYQDRVWRNLGQGRLKSLPAAMDSGVRVITAGQSRGYPLDADLDGDIDLFINNYRLHRNQFFQNQGNGTVTEAARDLQLQVARRPSAARLPMAIASARHGATSTTTAILMR